MNRSLFLFPHFIYVIPLVIFFTTPVYTFSGYCWTLDTLTRVNPNDSYMGSYYFWWTNLTYLPLFFALLCFGLNYLLTNKLNLSLGTLLTFFFLVLYSIELVDYLALNSLDTVSIYSYYGINTLLTNTLNRYHPLVFYLSAGLLVVALFDAIKSYLFKNSNLRRTFNFIWILVTINLIALWMGSWWALQEGTWGGWWNWDSSEMFGLLVSFIGLSLHHTHWSLRSTNSTLVKFIVLMSQLFASYFFIQLNFDLVSHNFGAKFFSLFNDNLFFFELLCLLYFTIVLYSKKFFNWSNLVNSFNPVKIYTLRVSIIPKLALLLISIGWVAWSYKPLLNYFLWNFAELNALNSEFSLQPFNFFAMVILFVWLIAPSINSVMLTPSLLFVTPHWLFTLHLNLKPFSVYGLLHLSLLMLSCLNIVLYDLSFTSWTSLGSYEVYYSHSYAYRLISCEWVLDTNLFDSTGSWLSFDGTYLTMWNAFINSNAPAINFFMLAFSHFGFTNLYILGSLYSLPTLLLEVPSILTLNFIFLLLILSKQILLWLTSPSLKT